MNKLIRWCIGFWMMPTILGYYISKAIEVADE